MNWIRRRMEPSTGNAMTASAATSAVIAKDGMAGGCLVMTAGDVNEITWYGKLAVGDTPGRIRDEEGTLVPPVTVDDDQPLDFPSASFAVPYLIPVAGAGTSGTFSFVVQG